MYYRFAIVWYLLLGTARSMFHKRSMGANYDEAPPDKKLRLNLASLYGTNDVSGQRAAVLFRDAHNAGADHFRDLRDILPDGNASRNVSTRLLRRGKQKWPSLYYAPIRVFDRKKQAIVRSLVPFLLPHEIIHQMLLTNTVADITSQTGLSVDTRSFMQRCSAHFSSSFVGLGLWADGVPCNWDRSQSLEVITMYLPGLSGQNAAIRFPVVVLQKRFVAKEVTYEDIFKVLVWSFESLAVGIMPSSRHDNRSWRKGVDARRSKLAGKPILLKGILAEIRGDWAMYSSIFRLGNWKANANCCWKCNVNNKGMKDFSLQASWRTNRVSHMDFLTRLHQKGLSASCLFDAPLFDISIFKIDWLHCMDLGCAADWIGNVFNYILDKFPGSSASAKCSALFLKILAYYARHPELPGKYENLVVTMFRQKKKNFKLRGKASEVRGLVGFAQEIVSEMLSCNDPIEAAIIEGCRLLQECYSCLNHSTQYEHLPSAGRKFMLLFKSLEDTTGLFRVKPKGHLLLELLEFSRDRPSDTWTYRDEEFGGTLAGYSRLRGGHITTLSVGRKVLKAFFIHNRMPRL